MLGREPTMNSLEQDIENALESVLFCVCSQCKQILLSWFTRRSKDQQLHTVSKKLSDLLGELSSAETKLSIAQTDLDTKKNECQGMRMRAVHNGERC